MKSYLEFCYQKITKKFSFNFQLVMNVHLIFFLLFLSIQRRKMEDECVVDCSVVSWVSVLFFLSHSQCILWQFTTLLFLKFV